MSTARPSEMRWLRTLIMLTAVVASSAVPAQQLDGPQRPRLAVPAESVHRIAADAIFNSNLIVNGDAETGPPSPTAGKVDAVPGWTTSGKFTVLTYDSTAEASLKSAEAGPADPGRNFFAGGPDNASSGAAQAIDVSAAGSAIDRGEVLYELAAYLGGWLQQNDGATLTTTFRGANSDALGQVVLGPVTAADRGNRSMLLPRSQSGVLPQGTRVIEFELRMIRAFGQYNDGYADSISFRLNRLGALQAFFQHRKIGLDSDEPSASLGEAIRLRVKLLNAQNIQVTADRDISVDIEAKGDARVSPPRVTIAKGSSSASATLQSSQKCGSVDVRAASAGLGEDRGQFAYCCQGQVQRLLIDRGEKNSVADGVTPVSFTIHLVDDGGNPVTDGKPKVIALDRTGVGRVVPSGASAEERAAAIPANRCLKTYTISSAVPGVATVTPRMGALSLPPQTFVFVLPLSIPLILVVMAGGAAGAFVRAWTIWKSSRRWGRLRWTVFLASNALIGLCVFLAYLYGAAGILGEYVPMLAGGLGLGFFLGMVGGYLGQLAMDRVAEQVVPASKGTAGKPKG